MFNRNRFFILFLLILIFSAISAVGAQDLNNVAMVNAIIKNEIIPRL